MVCIILASSSYVYLVIFGIFKHNVKPKNRWFYFFRINFILCFTSFENIPGFSIIGHWQLYYFISRILHIFIIFYWLFYFENNSCFTIIKDISVFFFILKTMFSYLYFSFSSLKIAVFILFWEKCCLFFLLLWQSSCAYFLLSGWVLRRKGCIATFQLFPFYSPENGADSLLFWDHDSENFIIEGRLFQYVIVILQTAL